MSGNAAFVRQYNREFCETGKSYSLINQEDLVPTMPMSYNDSTFVRDNLVALLSKDQEVDKGKMLRDGLMLLFEEKLGGTVEKFGTAVSKQIRKELGHVRMPEPAHGINYAQVGNIIQLAAPEYPLELKDSSILPNTDFLKEHPRAQNGIFINKAVYKKPSM